jgi:hypothetical protein
MVVFQGSGLDIGRSKAKKTILLFKKYLRKSYLGAAFSKNALSIDKIFLLKRDSQKGIHAL